MTNFYAYNNRRDFREDQAIYEAELERKRARQRKIDNYFVENMVTGCEVIFKALALTENGLIIRDDIAGDIWIAAFDKTAQFRLLGFRRCHSLEEAKALLFALAEESP